ncbi:MAG: hypothetical protein Kow0062_21520 [Acidobacteriota bacterium]
MRFAPAWLAASLLFVASGPPAAAQVFRQLTREATGVPGPAALDDAGAFVFAATSTDPLGDNPRHAFLVRRFDPDTGATTTLLSARDGVTTSAAVSDDGSLLAFASPADLVGLNHDRSVELYVAAADGSSVTQLTRDDSPVAGSVLGLALSGEGNRVAFVANTDPLGLNPQHERQLFVIGTDGTGLAQLTTFGAAGFGAVSISDDGSRIVFASDADPLGLNADRTDEIFTILADGSGLAQLTASDGDSAAPALSGDGSWIAFQSDGDLVGANPSRQTEIFVVRPDGTGLAQLTQTNALLDFGQPGAFAPSIVDDGQWLVFFSNHYVFPFTNLDSNFEIWRINRDGTGLQALTSSALSAGSFLPVVSGGGTRIAFLTLAEFGGGPNGDGSLELVAMGADGSGKRQLTDGSWVFAGDAALSPAGTQVVYVADTDPVGAGASLERVEVGNGARTTLVPAGTDDPQAPSVAADESTIAFARGGEIWAVQADGGDLRQLTFGAGGSARPAIAVDARKVVFDSVDDLAGGNADGTREIFLVADDGTGLVQLTSAAAGESRAPRADAAAQWVVFESTADLDGSNPDGSFEVFRARADGTSLAALTADPAAPSRAPDIDHGGRFVVWESTADPLGTNADGGRELFVWDAADGTTRQLTEFAEGEAFAPRISGDGTTVWFFSDAPVFDDDPDRPVELFRIELATGEIHRASALRGGIEGPLGALGLGAGGAVSVCADGRRAALAAGGDPARENPDALPEVFLADLRTPPRIDVSKATPTLVSWTVGSGPVRYDAIRGDVAELAGDAAGVDLGAVVCLEDDSPDADTRGFEDPIAPAPGQAFFYLHRGSEGRAAGPGSWGRGSAGGGRTPSSGDCAP